MNLKLASGLAIGVVALAAACGSSSSGGGTTGGSSPGTGSTANTVASIPSSDLVHSGQLTSCVDVPFEPLQYYTNGKQFTGMDIDLLTGVAQRLGLSSNPVNTDYATVVASLQSGKCDVIVSDQYVTPAREKQVNMVAYWKSNETVIVPSGNPKHITDQNHLCGLSVAGESGGLEVSIMQALSKKCQSSGQQPIQIQQYAKSPQALQALLSGHADAWMASVLTAATIQATGNAKISLLAPFSTPDTVNGLVAMSFVKSKPQVMQAVLKALHAMVSDGSYDRVFTKYHMTKLEVKPPYLVNTSG
jgi:polar amino acid transport system substrate-binding protein